MLPRLPQHLQASARRGAFTGPRYPRAAVLPHILQHIQVSAQSSEFTHHPIWPRAVALTRPLPHFNMFRWSYQAAALHVPAVHWQSCSRSHFNTSRCPLL